MGAVERRRARHAGHDRRRRRRRAVLDSRSAVDDRRRQGESLVIMDATAPALYPNVPTLKKELGSDWKIAAWRVIAAPKGIPADVETTLVTALKKVYDCKEYKDFMASRGFGVICRRRPSSRSSWRSRTPRPRRDAESGGLAKYARAASTATRLMKLHDASAARCCSPSRGDPLEDPGVPGIPGQKFGPARSRAGRRRPRRLRADPDRRGLRDRAPARVGFASWLRSPRPWAPCCSPRRSAFYVLAVRALGFLVTAMLHPAGAVPGAARAALGRAAGGAGCDVRDPPGLLQAAAHPAALGRAAHPL